MREDGRGFNKLLILDNDLIIYNLQVINILTIAKLWLVSKLMKKFKPILLG